MSNPKILAATNVGSVSEFCDNSSDQLSDNNVKVRDNVHDTPAKIREKFGFADDLLLQETMSYSFRPGFPTRSLLTPM